MIELERREATRFRAAVRRCVAGRPRGLAPSVILAQSRDGLTLSTVLEETAISLYLPGAGGPAERLVIPLTTLASLEGAGNGVAIFEGSDGGAVRCRLQERGETKDVDCASVFADPPPAGLPAVGKLHSVKPALVSALHACGQTAKRETGGRYALARLQLRGQAGEVAGTDGRQLLLWGGFELPFKENVLVPAVPVFGSRELAGEQEVRIGRTTKHVAVAVGPWTICLGVDATSPFPDVTTVFPRSSRLAKLVFDEAGAAALVRDLEEVPLSGDEVVPVVLEFSSRPSVRWCEGTSARGRPFSLVRSTCTGPSLSVTIDPKFLMRALSLGFREVRATSSEAPVLFRDQHRSYLVTNSGPAPAAVAASADRPALPAPRSTRPLPRAVSSSSAVDLPPPLPTHSLPQQGEPMDSERNGGSPTNPPPEEDGVDPMAEAEGLRAALVEVGRRVTRLIVSLRQFKKQRRALQAAWTSLHHLNLGTKEES